MRRYSLHIALFKEGYRIDLNFELACKNYEEANQKAQRYAVIAQSEEQADLKEIQLREMGGQY